MVKLKTLNMTQDEMEYHERVIERFEKILNNYSIRENNDLHTLFFDVRQSHAVLLEIAKSAQ